MADPLTVIYVKDIAKFAAEKRLPSMFGFREFCDAGGLLSYGANLKYQFRRYGYFIDKILRSFPDFAGKERFAFGEQRTSSPLASIV